MTVSSALHLLLDEVLADFLQLGLRPRAQRGKALPSMHDSNLARCQNLLPRSTRLIICKKDVIEEKCPSITRCQR